MMTWQELIAWLPLWAIALLGAPVALYLLLALLVPFSVFGVKRRLDLIDARLEQMQSELRAFGLGESVQPTYDDPADPAPARAAEPAAARPPEARPAAGQRAARRAEPRLDWPRAERR